MNLALYWIRRLAKMKLGVLLGVVGFWVIDFPHLSPALYLPNSMQFVFCFWLCRVLVASRGISRWVFFFFFSVAAYGLFSCGMWDLVP